MKLFGTDGIRDIAGSGNLSPEKVLDIAKGIATLLKTEPDVFKTPIPKNLSICDGPSLEANQVLVARDTRISGPLIESALLAGLLGCGVDVTLLGVIPTPALAYLTSYWHSPLGIMISASHNSAIDNGIKVLSPQGLKITPEAEDKLEHVIYNRKFLPNLTGTDIGVVRTNQKGKITYAGALFRYFRHRMNLEGIKIALDCAHGATSVTALMVLRELGAMVTPIGISPDGTNINEACGSVYPEAVASIVLSEKSQIGISLDGDGDRVILVDEQGGVLDGDRVLSILAPEMKLEGTLAKNTVVTTVMSNLGLELYLKKQDISMVRTPVGDRNVMDSLLKEGFKLGGEQSGHIIILDTGFISGDGLFTALKVIEALSKKNTPLSKLANTFKPLPQILINVKVKEKPPLEQILEPVLKDSRERLGDESRILLRYSGTEPIARVMVEGLDSNLVRSEANRLAKAIKEKIGEGIGD